MCMCALACRSFTPSTRQWNGDFSRDSPLWTQHPNLRRQARALEASNRSKAETVALNRVKAADVVADNGCFFMRFSDFVSRFEVFVCDSRCTASECVTVRGRWLHGVSSGGRPKHVADANKLQGWRSKCTTLIQRVLTPMIYSFIDLFCGASRDHNEDVFAYNPCFRLRVRAGARFFVTLSQNDGRRTRGSWLRPGEVDTMGTATVMSLFLLHPLWIKTDRDARQWERTDGRAETVEVCDDGANT